MLFNIILSNLFIISLTKNLRNFEFNKAELDANYWYEYSKSSVLNSYKQKPIEKRAKNVILFLGDGMGITTITPARILKGQIQNKSGEEARLVFEEFPYISLIKTYNVDYQVPDSAGTATAFLCGVKTNKGVLGVTAKVKVNETDCDVIKQNSVSSILKWALDSGRSAGIVTTTRITHATPGAGYAHTSQRDWEEDLPDEAKNNKGCKDIARQLLEDEPGSRLNVILGGGSRSFYSTEQTVPNTNKKGYRRDGQNMVENWLKIKANEGLKREKYQFVNSRDQLNSVDFDKTDYLFGLFNYTHVSYDMERDPKVDPSLEDMTVAALRVLKKNENGFVLLVEGGRIDLSHHDSYANMALYETLAFDRAIDRAMDYVSTDDTLLIVTADHSHTFNMNGYPKRGHNIMGIADKEEDTHVPFTTLMYANGPGNRKKRSDPTNDDTADLRYQYYTAVYMKSSNHGGEDVALYSLGPMAHLFRGTQEQTYVAHMIGFAACIGDYQQYDHCKSRKSLAITKSTNKTFIYFLLTFVFIIFRLDFNLN